MSVTQENDQEVVIDVEVLGQDQLAVIESMNEVGDNGHTAEESIARTVIPYNRDDDRARWLGYRACAFTSSEATQLVGKTKSCISNWRADPEFAALEKRLPEFRKQLANEYCELEFTRNYRLVMAKDHQILKRSLDIIAESFIDGTGKRVEIPALSKQDQDYLLKMRAYYTPQQLNIMTAITKTANGTGDDVFDFTKAVLTIAEHSRTMELKVGD